MIFQLVVSCVDFNYKSADKTDQTSIEDKTGTQSAKLYKVKIRGRWGWWGWLPPTGLLLFSALRYRERERREIVNSNLRPSQVVITYRVDSQH